MFALGPCWACKRTFTFDPDRVPSIPIDPVTNRPSDLGGDPARVVREPICSTCVEIANEISRKAGRPEIQVLPGAYGPLDATA
jgi:hypothetical protein